MPSNSRINTVNLSSGAPVFDVGSIVHSSHRLKLKWVNIGSAPRLTCLGHNGSNTLGTKKTCSRQGYFELMSVKHSSRPVGIIGIFLRFPLT